MISILCPSRGRPDLAKRMIDSALRTAGQPIEIILYLNDDDPVLNQYIEIIDSNHYQIGPDRSPGYSWNKLAEQAKGDILFLMGDDANFETQNWAGIVESAFSQFPDRIACVYPYVPGIKMSNNPHFCVHKNWISALGYFVPPHFWHWYVDTWTRTVAKHIGRYVCLENFPLPIVLDPADETTARADRLSLRERDHWTWDVTARHRNADIATLNEFIRNFK